MDRARKVSQVWNWLPAFRVVAETQHLPTASQEANLSASALSRAVRLLEEQLGSSLFDRDGRQLHLSPTGKVLLSAVRDAMRRIDDGMNAIANNTMAGPMRVSAPGPYASIFVLPAMQRLAQVHPDLRPHITSVAPVEVIAKLLSGALDLALLEDAEPSADVEVHLIGRLTSGVYAAEDHVLAGRPSVSLEDVLAHPFVGPPDGLSDRFPPQHDRQVTMRVGQMHVGVQVCAEGGLLAFLPDAIADAYRGDGRLQRLPIEMQVVRSLYAVHRRILATPNRILEARHALEDSVRGAARHSRAGSVQPPDTQRGA